MGHGGIEGKLGIGDKDAPLAYWTERFDGCETECDPEPDRWEQGRPQSLSFLVPVDEKRLMELCRTAGATPQAFFIAAYASLVSVFAGQQDVLFKTALLRQDEGKTIPFRVQLEGCDSVVGLIQQVEEQLRQSAAHDVPDYAQLADALGVNLTMAFSYAAEPVEDAALALTHDSPEDGVCQVKLRYDGGKYSASWAESFTATYRQLVAELLTKDSLRDLVFVAGRELEQLDEQNRTETPRDLSDVVAQFRRVAAADPAKASVITAQTSYSYADMDRITDAVAARLRQEGVGRGSVVSVLIHRNEYMPFASFGVLKSGAAYQPLDPTYPEERLSFMVQDAQSALLIADRDLAGLLKGWEGPILYTDDIPGLPRADAFDAQIRPDDLAVLLYTSGSTGTPKGTMLCHGNIAELADWAGDFFQLDAAACYGAYASYGFDAHMIELYPILTSGGSLCIVPDDIRLDLPAIGEYFNRHGVTISLMTTQVGRQFAQSYAGGSLKDLMVGGETLAPLDPSQLKVRLFNAYGPTECTVLVSIQRVDRLYHRVPIGHALANVKLYVVDSELRRLPAYAPGELLVAGPRVSAGYLHLPDKTESVFVPNPFSDDPAYGKAYRTGDVVRMLPDGVVDFIGRKDSQVKVRGFRIELPEVETVIREFQGIRDVTVQAFADARTGLKQLAAYVVSNGPVDVARMKAFILEKKPPYMVPASIMQLDSIPLTQNYKVNKRALPLPKHEAVDLAKPESPDEELAFRCAAEALGHSDFGVTTDLEEAGLSSIASMRLNVLLSEAFGRSARFSDLAVLHTVRQIASFFRSAGKDKTYERQTLYPLTQVQQGVYVDCLANPLSTTYNLPFQIRLDPGVDATRLKAALRAATNAHPYLKTQLVATESGEVLAERRDEAELQIDELDLSELPLGFPGLVHPFRLTGSPLVRIALIRDGDARWLFFDAHHLVFDGESMSVFFRDVERAYAGESLKKENFTGFEAALAERELRASAEYDEARGYFGALLAGRDSDCLPVRDRDESTAGPGLLSFDVAVDRRRVEQILREEKLTANALWNAAFGLTLSRFLARRDCVYATVYNGRNDSRLTNSVGMFVHTLPVVCELREGEGGRSFMGRMGRQLTESMSHDIYSFAEIAHELDLQPNILFVYQAALGELDTLGGLPATAAALQPNAAKEELIFFVFDTADGYRFECEYDARHYEEWQVRSIMDSMAVVAQALLRDERTDELSLLSPRIRSKLAAFNATEKPVENTDVVTLFRRAARQYPSRTALMYGDLRMTYCELDELSDRIAAYVQGLGIGREDAVSILIPRSEYMAVTALGVLKAGAAYQPLDPGYPPERLQYMVNDASAKLLIADEGLTHLLPDYDGPTLTLQDIPSLPAGPAPAHVNEPHDLFILLYTSGTTGQPKGVMLEHHNLVNFCDWYRTHYELSCESVVAAYASFGFDACMMDLWPALTTGAAVCIVPEELRLNLPKLNEHYRACGVTHVFMTTQMGRMFATGIEDTSLRHLSVGGERLVPLVPPQGYALTNGYGPTECTIFSTTQLVDRLYERIPIGSPLSNYKLYVTDEQGHELPVGAVGELWIAGFGVGRGYLNRPEITERAFVPNLFCTTEGFERAYRTGDLVRRLADGRIDFVGRNDGQVKVRGFRVELSEIEAVIREFPGIRDVTVQAFDHEAAGGKYIAAYVVADEPVDFSRLGAFILGKKPAYMVPAAWMQLDEIPLNQNQKVNRRALPVPEPRGESHEYVEPQTPLERELCERFAEILGLEKVGATDSFFDLGGSSITAAQIVMFAMNRGYSIVYKDIFDHPTPRGLAQVIEGVEERKGFSQVVDYDYTAINELISMNSMEHVDEISSGELGNVILTGATGYLGIHVLKALLDQTDATITCLMRKGRSMTPERRLMMQLTYYFGEPMGELFGDRIICVEGDITDPESMRALDRVEARTVINCAASVKHFVKDDLLDRVNFHGVENLIDVCLRNDLRLVQISTLSVAGFTESLQRPVLQENMLFFGQNVDNDYVRTKFLAERAVLEARVERGLDAVILRAGNLMGRLSDGEFQMNFKTNAFVRSLWAYVRLGKCPFSVLELPIEFSPIDAVAQAVLKLGGVDRRFSVFNMYNNHTITTADLIAAICRSGHQVDIVADEEFQQLMAQAAQREEDSGAVLSLVAYDSSKGEDLVLVEANSRFTTNALFRLDFRWPIIDDSYLEKALWALETLDFFEVSI